MDARLPTRYSSISLVAAGGMGDVYRATDEVLGRTVAVKLLAERHARDPEVRGRFLREGRAAARLSAHPHVVTVFDVGEHEERPFIVMEYLDGGTIHERARSGPVPPGRALEWLGQAASALDAAHAQGVVHRDVKPANLLLDEDERVHVSDFGIASAAGLDTLTLPGTVLGTAGYLSPEQARGETATAASDRYALGVVAFELLTGRRPYRSDTPVTEALAHVDAAIPSAHLAAPSLPAGVDAVFRSALAKDPRERPASAGQLVEELRDALRESEPVTAVLAAPPASATADAVTPPQPRARRRPGRGLAAAGLVALLLAGLVAAAFVAGDDDGPEAGADTRARTVVSTVEGTTSTLTVTETATAPEIESSDPDEGSSGAALNDEGYRLIQAGDFDDALPLLEEAVSKLSGSGSLTEAYASYNLAFTRFALGSCSGVPELLDRSEAVQGERREIGALRKDVEKECGGSPGKGKGRDGEDDD